MLEIIAGVFVVILAVWLIYAATQPNTFRIERAITINAAPEKIFPLINDFQQWAIWSPWEKGVADLKRTYSGAASGQGAAYDWHSKDNKIGQGRMEIIESTPASKITIKIDFLKPMEGHNMIEFNIIPQGETTTVTHAMFGPSPYINRLMCVFFNMDKMVGSKFEEGLANLQALAEK